MGTGGNVKVNLRSIHSHSKVLNNSCEELVQRTRGLLRGPRHTGSRIYLYDKFDSIGNISDSDEEYEREEPEEDEYIIVPVSQNRAVVVMERESPRTMTYISFV